MIVVQINSECGRGSTGKIVCAISNMLSLNNIENYIFYSGNHKSSFPNSIQINGKLSIRMHQILSRIFGDQGFHSVFSTLRMIGKLKSLSPDIIMLHNIHGYYLHIGILFRFLKEFDKPVYWILHDCWSFTGHCAHFTLEKCSRWKEECGNCPNKKKYPYSWFFDRSKYLLRRKKRLYGDFEKLNIITPSKWLAGLVRDSFLKSHNITVINNGIDTKVFRYTESTFKNDHKIYGKPMILGVSSVWNYSKGIDVFIELAKEKPEWQIVLVGTDDDVDSILPGNIISIHRITDQKKLAGVYSAADVFLNPTREDTYPTVNLEAAACGTPVVTCAIGGSPETIINQKGVVVYERTSNNLIHEISILISNKDSSEKNKTQLEQLDYRNRLKQYLLLFNNQ